MEAPQPDLTLAQQELTTLFTTTYDGDNRAFLNKFIEKGVCVRCILMLFRESALALYRILDFTPVLASMGHAAPTGLCTVCRGVLQHCNDHLEKLCLQVQHEGFEFTDFKITFSISIIAYLKRLLIIAIAEEELGKSFKYTQQKDRSVIDFKEIYKWIMSPLIAKRLNVPANLDGTFLIHVSFA